MQVQIKDELINKFKDKDVDEALELALRMLNTIVHGEHPMETDLEEVIALLIIVNGDY